MMSLLQEFPYDVTHVAVRTLTSAIKFTALLCDKKRELSEMKMVYE